MRNEGEEALKRIYIKFLTLTFVLGVEKINARLRKIRD
jgi:hypothetical protein